LRFDLGRSFIACLSLAHCLSLAGAQQTVALRGTVVTPAGPIERGIVLIEGSKITAAGANVSLPVGLKVVETGGIIYPGLIDLHDHVTWNVLPRWSWGTKFGARYDWQQLPQSIMALTVPHEKMVAEGHGCAAERYAEVKALAGGATSQAGLNPDDLTRPGEATATKTLSSGCLGGLIRELGVASRLYDQGAKEKLRYEVFPLTLDQAASSSLIDGFHSGKINAAMFHIAEGASDNASARREFAMLQGRGLLFSGVSIIHGVALSRENFAAMAKAGVGLIWSPRSNFELYGSTADVAGAKEAGVKIALAPDWSPTGSDGLLQELKYAAVWNASQKPVPFSDRELFEMATRNAAQLGGVGDQTGSIAPGMRADLLVLRPATSLSGDVYDRLVHSSPLDVELVLVDGVAVYGDPAQVKQMRGGASDDLVTVCGVPKTVASFSTGSWQATTSELTPALARWGSELSALAVCP
jgi:5-methylthioadenosine/S-adenosylhomocysteine deaminase